jgi:hypothetical protein
MLQYCYYLQKSDKILQMITEYAGKTGYKGIQ